MYDRHDQNVPGPEPIHQAIAVNEPFSKTLIPDLRDYTAYQGKFVHTPRNRQHFRNNRPGVMFRVSGYVFSNGLEILDCLGRPLYFEAHRSSFLSTSP